MRVIGTAGHVDHGKSTLVHALTGIDPDRLQEEKERGLTIDLGFAWMPLSDGAEVSIVDVPGHERFVSNMLAGVGGIDLALLVVAADESVMPQTREHLAILDLLNVRNGLVALTKRDLVDEEWLQLAAAEVEDALEGTTLEGAPIVPVSSVSGQGLPELRSTMERLLRVASPRADIGRPRLSIDRAFTMPGFGAVVTGTLIGGALSVGQAVEILPGGLAARVRGLQSHKKKLDAVSPGRRVAVNLSGVDHAALRRGDVLTTPGWLAPTDAIDVRLRVCDEGGGPARHNMAVTAHTGSGETPARLRLLDRASAEPGESVWAQLKLRSPIAVVKDDFFVARANGATLGGGVIVDTHAPRRRRNHAPTLERLAALEQGEPRALLLHAIASSEPAETRELASRANMDAASASEQLDDMHSRGEVVLLKGGALAYTASGWEALEARALSFLARYHEDYPLRKGAPKEELRSRLRLSAAVFPAALGRMIQRGAIVEDGPLAHLAGRERSMTPEQSAIADDYVARLTASPFSPPADPTPGDETLALLADEGRIVRANASVIFASTVYRELSDAVVSRIEAEGPITVGAVRDMFGASRKYALALLEHLDMQRVTRREGDVRVLR